MLELLIGINVGFGWFGVSEVNFFKWIVNEVYDLGFIMGFMCKDVGLVIGLVDWLVLDLLVMNIIVFVWENSCEMLDDSVDFNEIFKYWKCFNV